MNKPLKHIWSALAGVFKFKGYGLKLFTLMVVLVSLNMTHSFGQNMSINEDGSPPDSSAMLDVESGDKGFLMPRLSTLEMNAISNPAEGLMIYNLDSTAFFFFDGTSWLNATSGLVMVQDTIDANMFSAIIDFAGNIVSQSTPFIDSVTQATTGQYTIHFSSGVFTATPSVFAFANLISDINVGSYDLADTHQVDVWFATNAGSLVNPSQFSLLVMRQGSDYHYNTLGGSSGGGSGTSTTEGLDSVLANGNDAAGDTILNLGALGIGTNSPSTSLDVVGTAAVDSLNINGAYGLPTSDGVVNDVLQTDGAGNVSWASVTGDADWTVSGGLVYNTTERFAVGTAAIPASYFSEIETPTSANYPVAFSVDNNYTGASQAFGLTSNISAASTGQKFGTYNTVTANATQSQDIYGSFNLVNPNGTSNSHGVYNELGNAGTGQRIGVYNDISVGATGGNGYGVRTIIDASGLGAGYGSSTIFNGTGTSIRYGHYTDLGSSGTGQKWGLYVTNEDENTLSGELGIGTTNPQSKLHVISDGSLTGGIRLSAPTPATVGASVYLDAAVTDWTITASNNSYSAGANKLVFRNYSDASDVFTLTSGGRAGLGTTTPDVDFEIAQDSMMLRSPNNFSGTYFLIEGSRINGGAGAATIDLRNTDSNNGNTSYSAAKIETQNSGNSDDGDLRFYTTSNLVSSVAMRIDENGDVGIGTGGATPSAQLEVNGDVHAAGDVQIPAANDYTYAGPKTNYTTVSASAFTPIDNLTFDGTGTGNARWITGGTGGNANVLYAPVSLPDGASITDFEVYYNDNDATYNVYGELEGLVLGSNSIFTVATTATTTGTGLGSVVDNVISHTVDNSSRTYFIKFYTYENNSNLWIRGAKITYTVDKAD